MRKRTRATLLLSWNGRGAGRHVCLPIWWIAAGIGIRLGVYPSEFFRRLATAAGLIEPQEAQREPSTQG